MKPLQQPPAPNHRIHIDLFGPLATSGQGKKMVCVITDAFSKYTELVAIRSKEAGEVAKAIMDTWITRYSTPKEIVTDGGKEFANKLMDAICQELRVLHRQTTPYHPQTNASAEVFNRTMKLYLATALEQPYLDWEDLLPALRICYNTSVSKATRATPFSVVFGMDAHMPFFDLEQALNMDESYPEMLSNLKAMRLKAKEANIEYRKGYKKYYDKAARAVKQELNVGEYIWVENTHKKGANPKFQPAFLGPFEISRIEDLNVHYLAKGKEKVAHMNRIKPVSMPEMSSKEETEMQQLNSQKRPMDSKKSEIARKMRRKTKSSIRENGCRKTKSSNRENGRRKTKSSNGENKLEIPLTMECDESELITSDSQEADQIRHDENLSGDSNEETKLPDSPFPETPAFFRYRTVRAPSDDEEVSSQGSSTESEQEGPREESYMGQRARDSASREGTHLYENDIEMVSIMEDNSRKRKPESPLAAEHKREKQSGRSERNTETGELTDPEEEKRAEVADARSLRSRGPAKPPMHPPHRPLEYKAYRRKPCDDSVEVQSSKQ